MARVVGNVTVFTEDEIEKRTGKQVENLVNPNSKLFRNSRAGVIIAEMLGYQTVGEHQPENVQRENIDILVWCRDVASAVNCADNLNQFFKDGYPAGRVAQVVELDADNSR